MKIIAGLNVNIYYIAYSCTGSCKLLTVVVLMNTTMCFTRITSLVSRVKVLKIIDYSLVVKYNMKSAGRYVDVHYFHLCLPYLMPLNLFIHIFL